MNVAAVQEERGPRKIKTQKHLENENIISKNWNTRNDHIFEIGAQIFLTSLRQCRMTEPLIVLPMNEQNKILNKTWHQIFVLMAAFWPSNLINIINCSGLSEENLLATLITNHRAMKLDSVEYNLILTLILCRPDLCNQEFKNELATLDINAKCALMKHVSMKSLTRYYGIITCILSVTENVSKCIKNVFFDPSIRDVPINHLISVIT
ncbi:nuclear receptor subfamily 2 group E member 1 isoform X2 [Daktulosphaira vitifoliae]|nr:nuclear receptor subfamily 2 group E member 1 isoform X2 [Daktulosphaira vitifoliae]